MGGTAETNRDMLVRIVAMLLALAEQAERASFASHSVRRYVLGLLRSAEPLVQTLLFSIGRDLGAPPPLHLFATSAQMLAGDGDSPADAARVALSLRALAFALLNLIARSEDLGRSDPILIIGAAAQMERLQRFILPAACHSLPPPDT